MISRRSARFSGAEIRITSKSPSSRDACWRSGELTPPKDCRGKVKRPGFVYRYENQHRYCGFHVTKEEDLINCQLAALREAVSRLCSGDAEGAQRVLDGADFDLDNAVLDSYIGNVFLFRAVSIICADLAHGLAAAGGSTSALVDLHDHAAALFALKNYEFCHNNPFLLPETLCNKPGHEEL